MPFAARLANRVRRGAFVFLALWLLAEIPVVCQHGPMSLFDFEAQKADFHQHAGLFAPGETGGELDHVMAVSSAVEAAIRPIMVSPQQAVAAANLLETMAGVSEGTLPPPATRGPLWPALSLLAAGLLHNSSLPLPPPDQPPRSLILPKA